jgi:predicted alpha/beta-fold hydrolase
MPILKDDFQPYFWLTNPHVQTVASSQLRFAKPKFTKRERTETWDGDFFDTDFYIVGSSNLVVLLHGLEGSSQSSYIKGLAVRLNKEGYDVAALNFRGCSGESNRLLRSYHSGSTGDLRMLLNNIAASGTYKHIFAVGFSLGANVLLKYLGKKSKEICPLLRRAVAVSVPCDLGSSALKIDNLHFEVYLNRFLKRLKAKVILKAQQFPNQLPIDDLLKAENFEAFDSLYTAPVHGFKTASEYYRKSSSKQFLSKIKINTLIINSLDDPFLSPACFPFNVSKESKRVHLLATKFGGHCGFMQAFPNGTYWHEEKIVEFFSQFTESEIRQVATEVAEEEIKEQEGSLTPDDV